MGPLLTVALDWMLRCSLSNLDIFAVNNVAELSLLVFVSGVISFNNLFNSIGRQ